METPEKVYLSENLELIRKVWGKTQQEMSELFGITRTGYAAVELERNDASPPFLFKLERYTGIPASRLYYEKIERLEVYERPYHHENGMRKLLESDARYIKGSDIILERLATIEERVKALESKDSGGVTAP